MDSSLTHRFVDANGIRLHIAEQGQESLVLLLHGWPESWYSWRHQFGPLVEAGYRVVPPDQRGYARSEQPLAVSHTLVVLLLLGLGSLEIDRFCFIHAGSFTNPAMAFQTGLSVYWGLFSVGLIILGFCKSASYIRYSGLILMAITLIEVIAVDLAYVQYVYRVLSLLGMGLILVATSLGYARVRQRKAALRNPANSEAPSHRPIFPDHS